MGEFDRESSNDHLLKWDKPELEKDPKEDILKYAHEIKRELQEREGLYSEVPLAGDRSKDLYLSKFSNDGREEIFKEDILKVILKGEDREDGKELVKFFIDDEISEYQGIIKRISKLISEREKSKKDDPNGYEICIELSKYYETALARIKEIKRKMDVSRGGDKKILEKDLERAEREAEGFQEEMLDTPYGRKMNEIYDLMEEVGKISSDKGPQFLTERLSRLQEIKNKIEVSHKEQVN
jgi:hypothetical protein